MDGHVELEIWDGDWGLPSIDISCLQIMVYCKFVDVPVQCKVINNPFGRTLPTFKHGYNTFHNLQDVIDYLKTESIDPDNLLSKKDFSDIVAFSHLLKEKLYPALQFICIFSLYLNCIRQGSMDIEAQNGWVDTKNYVTLTRPWYAKKLKFPFNFYYPGQYEAHAKNLISCLYGSLEENYTTVQNKVYADAEKCLTFLSNKLGESKYFFGSQPSSLDAIVFSYLAPLLKAPFQNQALQNHLKACTNLVSFVDTIMDKYYSSLMHEYGKRKIELQKIEAEGNLKNCLKHQILAFFIAVGAMFGYMTIAPGFIRGHIKIDRLFSEREEEVD